MKRPLVWSVLIIVLLSVTVAADPVGFGVSGGILVPVAQEDQSSGSLLGIKIRANLAGPFTIEPNIHIGSFGNAEIAGVGSREGSSLKHYGVDITLGGAVAKAGLKPYLFIGGGIYNTKRDGDETTNKSGWSIGAGFALGIRPDLDIDIRGRFNIASSEGSTSRKSVGITAGVTYYVGRY
jgi:opacity protein-like surface antigen